MKFKVNANAIVRVRYELDVWETIEEYPKVVTERDVDFDIEDIWFTPKALNITDEFTKADDEPSGFRDPGYMIRANIQHHFGFHLPKNDRLITQIIVSPLDVEVLSQAGVSEAKKLERKLKQTRTGYSFPGGQITGF